MFLSPTKRAILWLLTTSDTGGEVEKLIVSCKSLIYSSAYDAGDYTIVRNTASTIVQAVTRWGKMSEAVIDRKGALPAAPSLRAQSALEVSLMPATRNRKGVPKETLRYEFELAEFLLVYSSKTRESSA